MTRKTITELLAQVATTLPDNNARAITPAVLRAMFTDFLDSIKPAYGTLKTTSNRVINAGTAYVTLPWDSIGQQDASEFICDAANGTITAVRGGVLRMTANFNFTADKDVIWTFGAFRNGIITNVEIDVNALGLANPNAVMFSFIEFNAPPGAVYTLRLKAEAANKNITITGGALVVEYIVKQ